MTRGAYLALTGLAGFDVGCVMTFGLGVMLMVTGVAAVALGLLVDV